MEKQIPGRLRMGMTLVDDAGAGFSQGPKSPRLFCLRIVSSLWQA